MVEVKEALVQKQKIKYKYNENNLISDLKEHKFDIVYLVGQDNLEFDKKK